MVKANPGNADRVKEFRLPDLGEGLTEGEILKWLVAVGDTVTQNQPIVEVETAKAAVEIPAKWAGRVAAIFHEEGSTIEVGTAIIAIDTQPDAGDLPGPPAAGGAQGATGQQENGRHDVAGVHDTGLPVPSAASLAAVELAPAEGSVEPGMIGGPAPGGRTAVLVGYGPKTGAAKRRPRKGAAPAPGFEPAPEPDAEPEPVAETKALAKPPVRKLARDLGVDLQNLAGSGPAGSITRDDVQAAVADRASVGVRHKDAVGVRRKDAVGVRHREGSTGADREQRIQVKGVRKLTAANMVASAFTAPHVTEFLTLDVTRSMKALGRLRERRDWRDLRISPLLLVARAVLLAVQRNPMVNSTWSEETGEIVVKEYVNLGIAAATPRGLTVPNIKDAGSLTLRELAINLNELVVTAKEGRTTAADMAGGTFTITNVGVFGVDTGTPILPPGEAAILVLGAIRETPWVHKGKIKIRQVTTLGISFDHRIIDGELGSMFLRDVGTFLADPALAMLAGD